VPADNRVRIAWDSCVIIDCLQKDLAGEYKHIQPIVERAEKNEFVVVVSSAYATAETYKVNGVNLEEQHKIIDDFYERPWVHSEDAGQAIGKIAAGLRIKHGIYAADSIHIATAVFTECSFFLTRDNGKIKKKTSLLALDGEIMLPSGIALRVMTPKSYDDMRIKEAFPLTAQTSQAEPSNPPAAGQVPPTDIRPNPESQDSPQ